MKPGEMTRPAASTRRLARPFRSGRSGPTAAIRSPRTATSAAKSGAPVPSATRPFSKTRSSSPGGVAATKKKAAAKSAAARGIRFIG